MIWKIWKKSKLNSEKIEKIWIEFGQIKDYKIGICCFSDKHAALMRTSWLARNQDNMSEWGYMSIRGLLFQ